MQARINGRQSAEEWIQDRGFAYGDGVFETVRVAGGELTLASQHWKRLQTGLERLHINWSESMAHQFQAEVRECAAQLGTGVIKMTVTRGCGGRGYAAPESSTPTRIVAGFPLPGYPDHYSRDGVVVRICDLRLGRQPVLAGIKHLNRLEQVLARSEWLGDAVQEGILLDTDGFVIEATAMNLFLVEDDNLVTPLLEHCGIDGVMRSALMQDFRARGVTVSEQTFGLERMLGADEIFLCNSVAGVWPVRQVNEQSIQMGPLTRQAQAYAAGHLRIPIEAVPV